MAVRFPSRPTLLALCCSLHLGAYAADNSVGLGTIAVTEQAIDDQSPLPPVFPGGQVARGGQLGILGNKDIMDVPFTMTSYTAQLIEDQQAEDVGDVLMNDASVRQAYGYANNAQLFVIRGLTLNADDISYNGLYGVLPRQILSTDALERVELFKGPNSFLNGVSPTGTGLGGAVNLVSKRASDTPVRRYTQDISSDGRVGEHLDLGQRFGEDNRFGARVNLSQREGDTGIDDENQRSKLFVAGLDYRGERFRVSTDFGYQKQRINQARNSVQLDQHLPGIPSAPHADKNYAPDWTYTDTEDTFGMMRGEYDLSEHWTASLAGGTRHTRETGLYGTPTLTDATTGAATVGGSTIDHNEDNNSFMAALNGHVQTGPISHQIAIGAATIWTRQENAYEFYNFPPVATNIYHPASIAKPSAPYLKGGELSDPGLTGKTRNRSIAISDTLGFFDDTVLITAGLRRQQLRVEAYDYSTGTRTAIYDEGITTPVYGIVYKPWDSVSFYANRIEGLAEGPTAPASAINKDDTYAPGRTKQLEAGVKFDRETYGATFGVFRIEKPTDGYTVTTGGISRFYAEGDQVNKGIELNLFGEPVEGLRVMAGATRLFTEMKNTGSDATDGKDAVGVPTFTLNASVDWDVPGLDGVALNARMLRTGGQYADAANTLTLPTWNRFDAGARYKFRVSQKDVTLRMNVENLTDKNYWASAYGGYLTQGEPRLVKFSGTVDF
jgi:iron complex outermembrane receptor protein